MNPYESTALTAVNESVAPKVADSLVLEYLKCFCIWGVAHVVFCRVLCYLVSPQPITELGFLVWISVWIGLIFRISFWSIASYVAFACIDFFTSRGHIRRLLRTVLYLVFCVAIFSTVQHFRPASKIASFDQPEPPLTFALPSLVYAIFRLKRSDS